MTARRIGATRARSRARARVVSAGSAASSASRMSVALWKRSPGTLCIARAIASLSSAGTSERRALTGAGGAPKWPAITAWGVGPAKGGVPVATS